LQWHCAIYITMIIHGFFFLKESLIAFSLYKLWWWTAASQFPRCLSQSPGQSLPRRALYSTRYLMMSPNWINNLVLPVFDLASLAPELPERNSLRPGPHLVDSSSLVSHNQTPRNSRLTNQWLSQNIAADFLIYIQRFCSTVFTCTQLVYSRMTGLVTKLHGVTWNVSSDPVMKLYTTQGSAFRVQYCCLLPSPPRIGTIMTN